VRRLSSGGGKNAVLTKALFYDKNKVRAFISLTGGFMVRIRLKKFGTKKRPFFRIVVQDSRKPRDGTTIEEIGLYHPIEVEDKQIVFDADRVRYWLGVGAQPSDTVRKILNKKNFTK